MVKHEAWLSAVQLQINGNYFEQFTGLPETIKDSLFLVWRKKGGQNCNIL